LALTALSDRTQIVALRARVPRRASCTLLDKSNVFEKVPLAAGDGQREVPRNFNMTTDVYIGLAVTSHNASTAAAVVFDGRARGPLIH